MDLPPSSQLSTDLISFIQSQVGDIITKARRIQNTQHLLTQMFSGFGFS